MNIDKKTHEHILHGLERSGLNDKEARLYIALLELGGATPSAIADKAKMHRPTAYRLLTHMSIKGLINEGKKGKKLFYQLENPKKLELHAKRKTQQVEDQMEHLLQIMPDLQGLFSLNPNKPVIRFFEGQEGIMQIYRDHIDVSKPYEMLAFSNTAEIIKFLPEKFAREYIKIKDRLGITSRGIVPDKDADMRYNEIMYANVKDKIKVDLRHVPASIFPFKSEITLYADNKVSIQNFSEINPVGVIIEDDTIYNMMRMIFELSWAGAKSLYTKINR